MVAGEIDFKKELVDLVDRIAVEVDRLAKDREGEIRERYGGGLTDNVVLDRLYEQPSQATHPVDAIMGLKILIADVKRERRLPLALAMYNIGVLWSYLAVTIPMVDVPLMLKRLHQSETGSADRALRWKSRKEEDEELLKPFVEAATERYAAGSKLLHFEMVDYLLKQPEFRGLRELVEEKRISRKRVLLPAIATVAKQYGLMSGVKKEKQDG